MATFTGGAKLQKTLAELSVKLKKVGTLRVGFLENATYPARSKEATRADYAKRRASGDDTPIKGSTAGDTMTVPEVAAFNEFGSGDGKRPPRPFFRNMISEKQNEWGPALARLLPAYDYDAPKALAVVGEGIAGQLRQSIVDFDAPPLADSTVAAKGSSKPLVDTGHMLASVDYEVKR